MNRPTFYIVLAIAALFALITYSEAVIYYSCQDDQARLTSMQDQLVRARELNTFKAQLLKRLTIESQSDLEIATLLKNHHADMTASPDQLSTPGPRGVPPHLIPDNTSALEQLDNP